VTGQSGSEGTPPPGDGRHAQPADERRAEATPDRDQGEEPREILLRQIEHGELRRILHDHKRWKETGGEEGDRANLRDTDLHDANLRGANLSEANLSGANLSDTDLRGANLSKAFLWEAHLLEANLRQARLRGAYLSEAKLSGANLGGADLLMADLSGADLSGANLWSATFQGPARADEEVASEKEERSTATGESEILRAWTTHADFRRADLTGANWSGFDLEGTNLREASLKNADLSGVTSLLPEQLAGADVTNARLPEDIKRFEILENVKDASSNARKIFLSMLLGCAYAWLTIAATTDARLLTNSATTPLPIIQVEIQIAWFYWAAPAILLGFFIYLHLYLEVLWTGLAGLPARFPDGKPLDQHACPWLLNGLVRRHVWRLREGRQWYEHPKEWISIFLAWWAVPLTLLGFWVRYLPRHHLYGTAWQLFLSVAALVLAIVSYRSAARILRGIERKPFPWKRPWRDRRSNHVGCILLAAALLVWLSYGAIYGVRDQLESERGAELDGLDLAAVWVPRAFGFFGYSTFASLQEEDVSTRPDDYYRILESDRPKSVRGANLQRGDLRYADAFRAFLQRADLREADLSGAYLSEAYLSGANLGEADLIMADLSGADLRGANLRDTDLRGANVRGANLSEANLSDTDLRGADLSFADLSKADLVGANLRGANLSEVSLLQASLIRADLSEASLMGADLSGAFVFATNLTEAVYDVETQWPGGFDAKEWGCVLIAPSPAPSQPPSGVTSFPD
jgi:uncharacterized protein YjbI with pentapeptide repeats